MSCSSSTGQDGHQWARKIFPFVHGLDESEWDRGYVASLFQYPTVTPASKIVVTSRVVLAYVETFKDLPGLWPQDLTQGNIQAYAESMIG